MPLCRGVRWGGRAASPARLFFLSRLIAFGFLKQSRTSPADRERHSSLGRLFGKLIVDVVRNKPPAFLLTGELHLLARILKMFSVTEDTCRQTELEGEGSYFILR